MTLRTNAPFIHYTLNNPTLAHAYHSYTHYPVNSTIFTVRSTIFTVKSTTMQTSQTIRAKPARPTIHTKLDVRGRKSHRRA
ncbi:hypothetical protein BCR39DRAFT_520797 [Naematelia encephala]|uniref:Uncharacterized protein n=1 Tax=Naematelia encephala TaxID=71784 RepID=A0A1Y2BG19_9TREE|nr:hypothetical protein BCR39DRAFT_520797 [Naematelia encephala]